MNKTALTIVIPVYNEEQVIPHLQNAIEGFEEKFNDKAEIVVVNDGSTDQTRALLEKWKRGKTGLIIHDMKMNSGHQSAIQAGLELATGDRVVTMDADLQDPIDTIFSLIEKSNEGFDVIHARRISRAGENAFRKVSAWMFYRLTKSFLNRKILLDVGDFRLLTRKALDQYLSLPERKFLRGEIIQLPLTQTVIDYHREGRVAGTSKFSIGKLMQLAWMAIRFKPINTNSSDPANDKVRMYRSL